MRCPTCGTENAPDSRFCGGCGARLAGSAQRVAPTQKISDDATFPQPQRQFTTAPGHGVHAAQPAAAPRLVPLAPPHASSGPPVAHGSAPQKPRSSNASPSGYANTPLGNAPNGAAKHTPPRARTAPADDPSLSMPIVAQRPWGLIIAVLLIDIGLAIAGGWMLAAGLGARSGAGSTAPRSGANTTPRHEHPAPLPSEST
jgi:hypothetical protein